MRILRDLAIDGEGARALVILLPGALQQPEDFVQSGFIEAVRKRGLSLDVSLADLGLEYIGDATDGTALQCVHDRLVQPARLENYRAIWLGGISIGALMAIAYADRYPGQIDGLCLLAPYPGNRILTGEITAAGGLDHWHPDCTRDDAECRVWQWLKIHRKQPAVAQIYLGYGQQDRFAPGQQLMAGALAADCVDSIAGGHDWPAWQQLWQNFLDRTWSGRQDAMETAQ